MTNTNWSDNNGKSVQLEYGFNFEGNFIGTGIYGEYLHMLNEPSVSMGTYADAIMQLGQIGDTGVGSGSHLHYDMLTKNGMYHSATTLRMLLGNAYTQPGYSFTSANVFDDLGRSQTNTRNVYSPVLYYTNWLKKTLTYTIEWK